MFTRFGCWNLNFLASHRKYPGSGAVSGGEFARDATGKSGDCGKATAGMSLSLGNFAEQLIAHRDSYIHRHWAECPRSPRCFKHFHDSVLLREDSKLAAGSPLAGVFLFRSACLINGWKKVQADRHLPHGRRPLCFREEAIAFGARKEAASLRAKWLRKN